MKIEEIVKGKRRNFTEVVEIICDLCNKSISDDCDFEFAELKATWGYDSRKDCEAHTCHMCEDCYDKIRVYIHSIGGVVHVENYSPGGGPVSVPNFP